MKKLLLIVSSVILLFSCQDVKRSPKPKDLIPQEKMVDVLTEVALMQGARSYSKKLLLEKGIAPYAHLTRKFGIDSVQFLNSNNYYAEHPKTYEQIYTQVKRRLEILMVKYETLREKEERKQDSLRALEPPVSEEEQQARLDSLKLDTVFSNLPPAAVRKFEILPKKSN